MRRSLTPEFFAVTRVRLALLTLWMALAHQLAAQGVKIDSITPGAARHGENVTIDGRGIGALNVLVTVGGVPAVLLSANGNQATFRVPAAAPAGLITVTAVNPGGQTGSIGFRLLEGVLLPGTPSGKALDATFDILPVAVSQSLIQNGVLLTRIDVTFAPDATVAQVNQALAQVEGGIVTMTKGFAFVTIAVPQQSVAALQQIAQTLSFAPGILAALVGREAAPQVLPVAPTQFADKHLLPTRFPAAWNAMRLALKGPGPLADDCATRRVPVVVWDFFQSDNPLPPNYSGFYHQIPGYTLVTESNGTGTHGYDVTGVLAALFDGQAPTGANPFAQCLQITLVPSDGLTSQSAMDVVVNSFPSGRFILNVSKAFRANVPAFDRAISALQWKEMTFKRWNEFFVATAAGNDNLEFNYRGVSTARYALATTVVTDPDTFWGFIADPTLWKPGDASLPDLTATSLQTFRLKTKLFFDGMDKVNAANNVLITGATTAGTTFADLLRADYSNSGPDASAVGDARTFCCQEQGTSFATPQVAGLASYLWLLSKDLRLNHPASDTRAAIQQNARQQSPLLRVIDAYASVLSLDAVGPVTPAGAPVRLAILDVDDNFRFDENDINIFLSHFLDSADIPVEPTTPDYSRYDLNGDGFTGGTSLKEAFDLDRASSTQYGTTIYSADVTQQIEGSTVHFNSNAVTDMDVLCYYAYSALYQGNTSARKTLLGGRCGSVQNFTAEASLFIDVQGFDRLTGAAVVPFQSSKISNSGAPLTLPLNLTPPHGTFQQTSLSAPVDYDLHVQANGPVSTRDVVPGTGAFTGNVSCSASGNTETRSDGSKAFPVMPTLTSGHSGSLSLSAPPGGFTFNLGGEMIRGKTVAAPVGRDLSQMHGLLFLQWIDAGGAMQSLTFEINDGTQFDPSPAIIPLSKTVHISPPGFIDLSWSLQAECDQRSPNLNGDIHVERNGTITVNYSIAK